MKNQAGKAFWKAGAALAAVAMVQACGSGGSSPPISTPRPAPSPTPSPSPTPTPSPGASFDTEEYRMSEGPEYHGAVTAWQQGTTGQGSVVAVLDTGIDVDSPEFAGRIHSASQDVAGSRGVQAEDDHGTNVSMIAAAARNDVGIMGIAYEAQVLALRTDTPGSCATDTPEDASLGCTFSNRDIARGIDIAVGAGATVINLSLGGSFPTQQVLDAVRRASAAGVVIVVAAGNYGDGSDPAFDRFQPTPFASSVREAGGDNVIIVGSVDEADNFSSFANSAGDEADWYLAARGERICCVYEGGDIYVGSEPQGEYVVLFSGTSFAAPQVSGAVALLKQAFPNLTAAEMVELLLDSARDAGASGTDATFGRGILDIAKAFQPAGAMSVAGTQMTLSSTRPMGIGSPAMGDALSRTGGSMVTIATDKYDRAFGVDLGRGLRDAAQPNGRLGDALAPAGRRLAAGGAKLSMAFTVADRYGTPDAFDPVGELTLSQEDAEAARVLAGRIAARVAPKLQIGFAVSEGTGGLVAQFEEADGPAFLVAGSPDGRTPLLSQDVRSFAARYRLARSAGISLSMESGEVALADGNSVLTPPLDLADPSRFLRIGAKIDRDFGAFQPSLSVDWIAEEDTVLGGRFAGPLATSGGESVFLTGTLGYRIGPQWGLTGTYRRGWTGVAAGGLVGSASRMASSTWSIDLDRKAIFGPDDRIAFRLSQPLRVESGGLNLRLPVAYSYATESATFADRLLGLSPTSRELVGEARWSGPVGYGWGGASLFYRKNPGHSADSEADAGVAASYSLTF